MKKLYLLVFIFIVGCQATIEKEDIIGKWEYTQYEFTNKSLEQPGDRMIKNQQPAIIFHENGKAEIYSSGKILSQGTYHLENKIIRYEEVLEGGTKRKIPFLIKKLDEHQLIFETMEDPVKRITAFKE